MFIVNPLGHQHQQILPQPFARNHDNDVANTKMDVLAHIFAPRKLPRIWRVKKPVGNRGSKLTGVKLQEQRHGNFLNE